MTGCGFRALHSQQDAHDVDLSTVKIAIIKNRTGQYLRNRLLDQINPYGEPKHPSYGLYVSLKEEKSQVGIRKNETAKREQITLIATVTVKDEATKVVLKEFVLDATSSFSIGSLSRTAAFSATVAEDKAAERAADMLATEIVNKTRASLHQALAAKSGS